MNGTRSRLLATCFAALVATSFGFVLRAMVIDDWGREFGLSETQKGELLGVGLWPFAISIVVVSLVIDRIGGRAAMWFGLACHVVAAATMIGADGYWSLYVGTFIVALGNGTIEAAINPAIATAYADDRTRGLNILHAGWPAGLVLGGLMALALGAVDWRLKIALILLPTVVYGVLLLRQAFPVSDRVAQHIPWREMLRTVGVIGAFIAAGLMTIELGRVFDLGSAWRAVLVLLPVATVAVVARSLGRPLFLVLLLMMVPLATTELGTDSWITGLLTSPMEAMGLSAGWVLVWTSLLMVILRFSAGPFARRLTPLGLLAASSLVAALGLALLSQTTGLAILAAATLYGVGKAFLWPTMLGVVADRFPGGGALALNLVAAVGMLSVGIVGVVVIGYAQDREIARAVVRHDGAHGTRLADRFLVEERSGLFGAYRTVDQQALEGASAGDARSSARCGPTRGSARWADSRCCRSAWRPGSCCCRSGSGGAHDRRVRRRPWVVCTRASGDATIVQSVRSYI